MGKRGPAPKPDALKTKINRDKRGGNNLADDIKPPVEIPECPDWLCATGQIEWLRITPHLEKLGLLSHLDLAALALYCQSFGRYVELERGMAARIEKYQREHGCEYVEAVHWSFIDVTPNGHQQMSALASTLRGLKEEVLRYLAQFGLSPSSRTRVAPSKQLELPGFQSAKPENPWEGFPVH